MGSMVNNCSACRPRYDGDLSWISPRWHGLLAEAHYAFAGANPVAGTATSTSNISPSNMAVYQLALDYLYGPFRIGYAGIEGRPDYNGHGEEERRVPTASTPTTTTAAASSTPPSCAPTTAAPTPTAAAR